MRTRPGHHHWLGALLQQQKAHCSQGPRLLSACSCMELSQHPHANAWNCINFVDYAQVDIQTYMYIYIYL